MLESWTMSKEDLEYMFGELVHPYDPQQVLNFERDIDRGTMSGVEVWNEVMGRTAIFNEMFDRYLPDEYDFAIRLIAHAVISDDISPQECLEIYESTPLYETILDLKIAWLEDRGDRIEKLGNLMDYMNERAWAEVDEYWEWVDEDSD